MIDKSIRSGNPKVDAYINLLESKFEFNKLYQFIMAANDISGIMAEDMVKIAKGETIGLKILSKDKDEKFTERLTLILKQIDVVKKISDEADKLVNSGKVADPNKIELNPNVPAVEQLMQVAKNGGKG